MNASPYYSDDRATLYGGAHFQTGRKYIGIELNREYLDLSLRTRFAQPALDFGGEAS